MATTLLKILDGYNFTSFIAANGYDIVENEPITLSSKQLSTGYMDRVIGSDKQTTIRATFMDGISQANLSAILGALNIGKSATFEYWSPHHGHTRKALFSVKKDSVRFITYPGKLPLAQIETIIPSALQLYNGFSITLEQIGVSSDITTTTVSKYAGTVDSTDGTWTDPNNIKAAGSGYVTTLGGLNTDWDLKLSNFGFAIPAGSIINSVGIEMSYYMSTADSSSIVSLFAAYKGVRRGAGIVTTNKPLSSAFLPTYDTGNWTVDQLNSADAQMFIRVRRKSSVACTFYFDYALITVNYTEVG